jgi:hypothetical protein
MSFAPGLLAIGAGIAMLFLARIVASPILVFITLPALSLILHFGIIDLTRLLSPRGMAR